MRAVDNPLPIFRLQVGELKARLMGGSPQGWARVALMTDEGITIGDASFSAWSPESWDLLKQLCASIEKDFESTLSSQEYTQWGSSSQQNTETEEDDISFKESASWELT